MHLVPKNLKMLIILCLVSHLFIGRIPTILNTFKNKYREIKKWFSDLKILIFLLTAYNIFSFQIPKT